MIELVPVLEVWYESSQLLAQTAHLLLIIIVVGTGQQMSKDELWHIHILILVHFNRNTITIVPNGDGV